MIGRFGWWFVVSKLVMLKLMFGFVVEVLSCLMKLFCGISLSVLVVVNVGGIN